MRQITLSIVITYLFYLVCWVAAILLTILQVIKYTKNEDIVDISYKSFYSNQESSNYPGFSICFLNKPYNEFNETKLPKNVTSTDLAQILKGNHPIGNNSLQKKFVLEEFLRDLSFNLTWSFDDLLKTDVKNVFKGYRIVRYLPIEENYNTTQGHADNNFISLGMTSFHKKLESLNSDTHPFRCWSPQVKYIPRQVIVLESLNFAEGSLIFPYQRDDIISAFVSLHHENQLIRGMNSMIDIGELINLAVNDTSNLPVLKISITQVKNIVRRHDSNQECDPNLNNDDEKFLQTVSEMLGCIPIFWKDQLEHWFRSTTLGFCNKVEQYKRYWSNFNSRQNNIVHRKYTPPCKKVSLTYDISSKEDSVEYRKIVGILGDLLILIDYRTDEYEEIVSLKKFDEESLFSQVGGLIGIMVGVSFINIPNLLEKIFSSSKSKFENVLHKDKRMY